MPGNSGAFVGRRGVCLGTPTPNHTCTTLWCGEKREEASDLKSSNGTEPHPRHAPLTYSSFAIPMAASAVDQPTSLSSALVHRLLTLRTPRGQKGRYRLGRLPYPHSCFECGSCERSSAKGPFPQIKSLPAPIAMPWKHVYQSTEEIPPAMPTDRRQPTEEQ